jgi:hypothetical protein
MSSGSNAFEISDIQVEKPAPANLTLGLQQCYIALETHEWSFFGRQRRLGAK